VLEGYPDIKMCAIDVLARDIGEPRCALIQVENLQKQAQQQMDHTDTPADSSSR